MMKLTIDDYEIFFEDVNDVYDQIRESVEINVSESEYDDMLDECYPEIEIGCSGFYASNILRNCDRIAYDIGYNEYIDNLVDDIIYEIEQYGSYSGYDIEIETIEDEEE